MTPRPKILLVDPRKANRVALETVVADVGCGSLLAGSGSEALELIPGSADDIVLVLIGVELPDMDGRELARQLQRDERTASTPIVFVGNGPEALDHLPDPLEPRLLRRTVLRHLSLHDLKRRLAEADERLREADRKREEFLAVLSHELRNPLMPIRASLFLLDRVQPGSDQARRALAVIERQSTHLTRLVDDLLDVARMRHGTIQLRCVLLDLGEVVRKTVDDHRMSIADAGLALEVAIPDEPLLAVADVTRVAQIVGNLLTNAIEFSQRGGGIRVALRREGPVAELSVRDRGIGIAPELLARLFQPFEQADRTLERRHGGLGLGLALVAALARLHGGSVAAASEGVGRGAELIVRLPLAEEGAALPPPQPKRAPTLMSRRVLVVEDNLDGAETLKEVIELLGHEVAVVHDGLDAIDAARAFRPDIVLCDIGLPGMDGYDVARELRRDQELGGVLLVALTGYALPEDQRRAFDAGFSEHMAKPVKLEALERLLSDPDRYLEKLGD